MTRNVYIYTSDFLHTGIRRIGYGAEYSRDMITGTAQFIVEGTDVYEAIARSLRPKGLQFS